MEKQPLDSGSKILIEMHAIISGEVQGVFFRATTQRFAQQLNVKGTVQNLSTGAVEIFAQGEKSVLESLLEMLKREYGSNIFSIDTTFTKPDKAFSNFRIIH